MDVWETQWDSSSLVMSNWLNITTSKAFPFLDHDYISVLFLFMQIIYNHCSISLSIRWTQIAEKLFFMVVTLIFKPYFHLVSLLLLTVVIFLLSTKSWLIYLYWPYWSFFCFFVFFAIMVLIFPKKVDMPISKKTKLKRLLLCGKSLWHCKRHFQT